MLVSVERRDNRFDDQTNRLCPCTLTFKVSRDAGPAITELVCLCTYS